MNGRFVNMKNTEIEGVNAVQNIVFNDLGWIVREQTTVDYGIDAEIEVADQTRPTGKVIAAQIKSGNSYFQNSTKENIIFYFDETHKKYWLKHVLPVIVLLYHPISKECIWEVVNESTVERTNKRYRIVIPKENQFGRPTKEKLLILAYYKNIEDLAEEIDDLDVDKELLFAMLDEQQKKVFRKTRETFNKKNAAADQLPFEEIVDPFDAAADAGDGFDGLRGRHRSPAGEHRRVFIQGQGEAHI